MFSIRIATGFSSRFLLLSTILSSVLLVHLTGSVVSAQECEYTMTSSNATVAAGGGTGSFGITASYLCNWGAESNAAWITLTPPTYGTGTGTIRYTVQANPGQPRIGTITTSAGTFTINQAGASILYHAAFDFDGDGKTDIGIARDGSSKEWWISRSTAGLFATQFGVASDVITPADFTGDGKADIAFWRPSSGTWYVLRSEDFSFFAFPFGANGDVPVPGDFDGDGKADAAVFRPSNSTWYQFLSGGGSPAIGFLAAGDKPVVADYDGDGKSDIAIFRPSGGSGQAEWWIQRSTAGLFAVAFGNATDKPVQGDYTGDGKADVAFWRPSSGEWYVLRSENLSFYAFPWGGGSDIPAPGDYDGDGKYDAAVFRPSEATWYINRTTAGTLITAFGANGDRPIPNAFVP